MLVDDRVLQTGSMQYLLLMVGLRSVVMLVNMCPDALESLGAKQVTEERSGQSMPKPSQPSLMASCSILCTSSYESYVGRHSWLKLQNQGGR